jgi:F0F1-type ATP synthase delta subunit
MREFNGLVKRKSKALAVFVNAKLQLAEVCDEIYKELHRSTDLVAKEQEKQRFLSAEAAQAEQTMRNIDRVLTGE